MFSAAPFLYPSEKRAGRRHDTPVESVKKTKGPGKRRALFVSGSDGPLAVDYADQLEISVILFEHQLEGATSQTLVFLASQGK
jgi:hypothetical protein